MRKRILPSLLKAATGLLASALLLGAARAADVAALDTPDDAVPGYPFKEGDALGFQDLDKIRGYIPEPFWENRDYFFFEGMTLRIGPFHADFSPSAARMAVNARYGGQASVGAGGALENYTLGRPFPEIDPEDPQAGIKHAWNMDYKHDAMEGKATWYFTYWDRGEKLPLWYKGTGWGMRLSRRTDQEERGGDIFRGEKRKGAGGITITAPFDARGLIGMGYRYLAADHAPEKARRDDVWVYIPWLRRVRRLSSSERTDAIAGTDATADDAGGFSGITPQFEWRYLGEAEVLAPIDSRLVGYPYTENANFGPTGFSLANDVWHVRKAIVLEQTPRQERHPYRKKLVWVDAQTYVVHYAAAWDRRGELWKLIQTAHRWSESDMQEARVDGLRAIFRVCDVLVNVFTGTGVRIEFFDVQPTQLRRGQIRRQIDLGRLSREGR
jgi:hypothetical protein